MKCVNHLQYRSRFSLSGSLSSCMTCKRYGRSFKIFVAIFTLSYYNPFWRESFLSDFRGEQNKVWRKSSNYRHLTPKVDRNCFYPARFLCLGNGSAGDILSICFAQENREMYPWTHSGRLSKNEVFENEHLLHLWKRHPWTLTVWQQLTDWREQVATWRGLRRLLYSHSDIVVYWSNRIVLNCNHMFVWVAWLFDHSVYLLRERTVHIATDRWQHDWLTDATDRRTERVH
jgi:hypothetical protein